MGAANSPLLTILPPLPVVQIFLQKDLKLAPLSQSLQAQREIAAEAIESIITKVRHAHPSIRPRVNTPSNAITGKKPSLAPPAEPLVPTSEVEEDLYDEAVSSQALPEVPEVEDYLSFEPTQNGEEGVPQELYEAMVTLEDQELYEEPGKPAMREWNS